ncbi:MAG: heme oxygenase (biliverdin-producing) [Synechococcales cyanobacterium K44_A2020_017]|jgi:heme oxygenase|uniref:biliverdin-producing heme oxygenase n=1 Tax=Leptolyngbya sp. CCY15150 TaxID=2767772 RepID=UPI001952816F|nr:heme oxygenase (biliverdin-producing) [Leptolyngbya sp. CCY15150]MBF2087505.1 heme oxygenase (biliverdin-producing) [Synechococcales cyanobacterium K32_A2020_035]MBF2094331.1 heme oxygenase (biliverdin-producing) [Synechococcales cyanobacterium K44_A2020_017]
MTQLSARLREGTQQSHTAAENTAFMKCFLKGIVEREPLRKLFADLYFVYSTLETAFQHYIDHPIVGAMYFPDLNRADQLAKDLAYYYGDTWRDQITATPAGVIYCDRIKTIAETDPVLLIAHSYTRYMGDLSGGQSLKNIIRSALDLPSGIGTDMYEFPALATPAAKRNIKEQYRQALDSLPLDDETIERIVAEANDAFTLNRDVMHELEDEVKAAIGDHTFDLLTRQDRPGSTARCPHHSSDRELAVG